MNIRINTKSYEVNYNGKPRGESCWAYKINGDDEIFFTDLIPFTEIKREVVKELDRDREMAERVCATDPDETVFVDIL